MEKVKYLGGLRGIAALIVVFHHFLGAFFHSTKTGILEFAHSSFEIIMYGTPLNLLSNGFLAVQIFFVLSGYVLSYKFFKSKNNEIVISGMIRRYFRLVIPVLFAVFIAYLFMKLSFFYNTQIFQQTKSFLWLSKLWNFNPSFIGMLKEGLFTSFFTGKAIYLDVLWTMKYEFFGSFLVFGFLLFFGKWSKRYFIYSVLVGIFFKTQFLGFIFGMILSDLMNMKTNYIEKLRNKKLLAIILATSIYLGSYPMNGEHIPWFKIITLNFIKDNQTFYLTIASLGFMLVIMNSSRLKAFLSSKIPVLLGEISFSLYLTHLIIICSFSSFLFKLLYKHFSYLNTAIIVFIPSLILCLTISYLMNKYIDQPAIRFSYFIYNKLKDCFLKFKRYFLFVSNS